jgi:hypothetical protein
MELETKTNRELMKLYNEKKNHLNKTEYPKVVEGLEEDLDAIEDEFDRREKAFNYNRQQMEETNVV